MLIDNTITAIMDLDNFIEDNINDIIDNSLEPQPELTEQEREEVENDLEDLQLENSEMAYNLAFKQMMENIEQTPADKHEEYYNNLFNQQIEENEDTLFDNDHYMNLFNIFVRYYNEKFDKVEHFFSGIEEDGDNAVTSNKCSGMIELFLEAIFELRYIMDHFNIDDVNIIMKMIYNEKEDSKIISDILNCDDDNNNLYCLEIKEENKDVQKIYSLSLLVCLNYVVENVLPKQECIID